MGFYKVGGILSLAFATGIFTHQLDEANAKKAFDENRIEELTTRVMGDAQKAAQETEIYKGFYVDGKPFISRTGRCPGYLPFGGKVRLTNPKTKETIEADACTSPSSATELGSFEKVQDAASRTSKALSLGP